MAGEKHYITGLRIRLPEYLDALQDTSRLSKALPKEVQAALVDGMRAKIHARIPAATEDTLPGELANVIAGRIANLFNFAGPNFITDAACASSLAAFQTRHRRPEHRAVRRRPDRRRGPQHGPGWFRQVLQDRRPQPGWLPALRLRAPMASSWAKAQPFSC